jgi:hypothetical protein
MHAGIGGTNRRLQAKLTPGRIVATAISNVDAAPICVDRGQ